MLNETSSLFLITGPGGLRYWRSTLGAAIWLWLIPFVISIPFFSPQGELLTGRDVFKLTMHLSGGVCGTYLLYRHLKHWLKLPELREHCIAFGFRTGVLWLLVNWLLDFLILLPLSGQTPVEYFVATGLGYMMMVVTAVALAAAMRAGLSQQEAEIDVQHR